MSRLRSRLANVAWALLLLCSGPAVAAERPFLLGVSIGLDAPMEGEQTLVGELFGRYSLSPNTALEAALSHRKVEYVRFGGRSGEDYTLTQTPLLLGVRHVLNPTEPFLLHVGCGLHATYTRVSHHSYVTYPGPHGYYSQAGSDTKIVVGGYAGLDAEIRTSSSLRVLSGVRFIYNPVAIPFSTSGSPAYLRLFLGGGAHL